MSSEDPDHGEEESGAVAALERLGLPNYEARVFVALQRLGTATAREIHESSGLPRSQVYGAADELEDRGLVDVQQSRPKRYHAVDLEQARDILTRAFERDRERAFDRLESVRSRREIPDERPEEIWTLTGRAAIDGRVGTLLEEAEESVLVSVTDLTYLPDAVAETLEARVADGLDVIGITEDRAVAERFEALGLETIEPPARFRETDEKRGTRLLLVDDDALLVAVESSEEVAVWSVGTTFATVFGQLIRRGLTDGFDG
ncbi:TrmB family transcriptional regulator [Salinirubellus sp. GCM10025818]|uniref:TrmB family transcriptional regulator n=1 Tax=Salinirubellus TaxID=2162630 RepID=UPI0030CB3762